MLRNNAGARRCSYFELGLPVKIQENVRNKSEQGILWHFRFETFRTEQAKLIRVIN